jgi:hypothetical protein
MKAGQPLALSNHSCRNRGAAYDAPLRHSIIIGGSTYCGVETSVREAFSLDRMAAILRE